jgi:catechol 2,3-dioxygenase-like lactoylglutathione lyase family enzyme
MRDHTKGRRIVNYKLELVLVPVTDVGRAKTFYTEKVGFNLDVDHRADDDFRTGYYARCIGCLTTGPERLSGEAARKALRVLGVRDATAMTR